MQLIDFGERRLINELLSRRYSGSAWRFGDDVAVVANVGEMREGLIVATVDPAPEPVAWKLGHNDYYYYGWLTAAISLSDLAAAGADPLALLTSFILPNSMRLTDFERLLDGVDDCCASVGAEVRGGNLKEGRSVHCEATAIGLVPEANPLSRSGARPGDTVYAIGNTGYFWAGMLTFGEEINGFSRGHDKPYLTAEETTALREALLLPRPMVEAGRALRSRSLASSCTDNSDGLYGALLGISHGSGVGVLVDADNLVLDPLPEKIASFFGVEAIRLALGFGDTQLICTVPSESSGLVEGLFHERGMSICRIGEIIEGEKLLFTSKGSTGELTNFDNERFTLASQFTGGIEAYEKRIFREPLTAKTLFKG